ncbi:MAG: LD-carboxypeptidase [Bacteroidia bacterium]
MKQSRRQFITTAGLASLSLSLSANAKDDPEKEIPAVLKPPSLKPGDLISISSPAGAVWDATQIDKFSEILRGLGFKVRCEPTLKEKYGYFAGTDEFRAGEFNRLILDKEVKAVFCMKGGWGCARLLDKINFEALKSNPKIIMGFSDITTLLVALNAKTGLVTFHGPVGNSGWNDFTTDYVKRVLLTCEKVEYAYPAEDDDKFYPINPGNAKGILVGGNLTVLAGIMGSAYLPDWKGKILFLEETSEEPYRIDRMLTQLKLNGVLDNISGFIFGKCVKCDAEEPDKAFTLRQVLEQHLKPLKTPAFYGAMIGHIVNKYTVPIGVTAEMEADKGILRLTEAAVI